MFFLCVQYCYLMVYSCFSVPQLYPHPEEKPKDQPQGDKQLHCNLALTPVILAFTFVSWNSHQGIKLVDLLHIKKNSHVKQIFCVCQDPDMFWDFLTLRPETCHQVSFLFSNRGTPDGYRHMNGYGSHTFKLVNKDGEAVYCKFHCKVRWQFQNVTLKRLKRLYCFVW